MSKQYEYKEVTMSNKVDMITQLNEQGLSGWEFITQAQKITPAKVMNMNGQPQIEIVMIFKREKLVIDKNFS